MKQLWFGAGLLAALLAVSILLGAALEHTHQEPAKDLEKAADAALEADWALATALYTRAAKHWDAHRNLSAALVSHGELDRIDGIFAQLEVYIRRKSPGAFAAACAQLAQQLHSLPQSHSFSWWNLL